MSMCEFDKMRKKALVSVYLALQCEMLSQFRVRLQASLPCRLVKFQRVNVLTIFFASNHGDKETTIVQQVSLIGTGGETFNVKDIKKVGEGE